MTLQRNLFDRVASTWVVGAFYAACALLAVAPILVLVLRPDVVLIYLFLPVYMLHQVEEHHGDAFRRFVNGRVFGGREALTVCDVLWINLPGVWGVDLLALYAAMIGGAAWGLVAPYLALVNGLAHVVAAVRFRAYNPGLWTALALFIPLATLALSSIAAEPSEHAFAIGVALLFHAAIVVRTMARDVRLRAGAQARRRA